eukprot:1179819-Prorocentrum_minimum.AAC.3
MAASKYRTRRAKTNSRHFANMRCLRPLLTLCTARRRSSTGTRPFSRSPFRGGEGRGPLRSERGCGGGDAVARPRARARSAGLN